MTSCGVVDEVVTPLVLSDETTTTEDVVSALSVNTTETPAVTNTTATPTCQVSQHFDIASFIGGMVLAFGTVAIVCFSRLIFQARHEHTYNTL